MSYINPVNVVRILSNAYADYMGDETVPSRQESLLARKVKEMIDAAAVATASFVEDSCGLTLDSDWDGTEYEIDYAKMFDETDQEEGESCLVGDPSQGSDYLPTPPGQRNFVDLDYKRKAVEYWNGVKQGKRSLSSVQSRFKKVSDAKQLWRWELQLTAQGSRIDKCRALSEAVFDRFQRAVENHAIVRELHIRRWALIENQEIGLENFRASRSWAWKFQSAHRVVSRKVTKFVTTSYAAYTAVNMQAAKEFVESVIPYVETYGPSKVYNSDQSGFQLSMHSGRTLAPKGAKHVLAAVQSVSATTHSYTIQPTIAGDGSVLPLLFMVLQEPSGNFGPIVQKDVDEMKLLYNNVYITASRSGKLTKSHLLEWLSHVYGPFATDRSILLVDSWTTYNDEDAVHNAMTKGKTVTLCRIPPGTTGIIQPEDVYFFRPWKEFDRTICNYVTLEGLSVTLHHRKERVKRQSLIWRQFCAPRYGAMIRYAFYACGYLKAEKPEEFENPVQYCFHGIRSNNLLCDNDNCGDVSFLRCSYCEAMLCFDCFYVKYHNCT